MRIFLTCDGACEPNPGQMAVGAVATRPDGENKPRVKILEVSEKLGKGTNNQAEYHAIIKGLEAVQKLYEAQGIPTLKEIIVLTDSQLAQRQIIGQYAINEATLGNLADRVSEIQDFFKGRNIRVNVKWQEKLKSRAAHNLAMKAMLGEPKFKEYMVKQDLIDRIEQGEILIPLDVLRMKKFEKLTVSECIVVYLLDTCGKSPFQVAGWMGRSKSTIRTQYARAKKKLPATVNTSAMPPNYLKRDTNNAILRVLRGEREEINNDPVCSLG